MKIGGPREIGARKTPFQHAGNVGFGLASAATLAAPLKALKLAPVLHLGVLAVETYNACQESGVVSATHAGNAVGCFASFLESSAAVALVGKRTGLATAMGAVGGALGLAAGTFEIRQGLANVKAGGSHRTLLMGALDITSGLTSFAGAGVALRRIPGPLGPALLVAASALDLSGIAVDYLGPKG